MTYLAEEIRSIPILSHPKLAEWMGSWSLQLINVIYQNLESSFCYSICKLEKTSMQFTMMGVFKVIENLALVPGFEVGWLFISLFFPWGVVFPSFRGWETHGLVFNSFYYVIHLELLSQMALTFH